MLLWQRIHLNQYGELRRPTEQESLLAERVVVEQGLFVLSRSLLNSNEFVYVD